MSIWREKNAKGIKQFIQWLEHVKINDSPVNVELLHGNESSP